jgi:hypothetical protein
LCKIIAYTERYLKGLSGVRLNQFSAEPMTVAKARFSRMPGGTIMKNRGKKPNR